MPIYSGSRRIGAIYKGSTAIDRVYKGSTLVWEKDSGGVATPQPTFSNVVLLAGFESGNTEDESSIGAPFAPYGSGAAVVTTQTKFGTRSLRLPGTGGVDYGDRDAYTPSNSGFCMEAWIRFDPSANMSVGHTIMSQWNYGVASSGSWIFLYLGSGNLALFSSPNGSTEYTFLHPWTPTRDQWYHVAVERSATAPGTYRFYIDGVMVAKTTTGFSGTYHNTSAGLIVGAYGPFSGYFHGWIDEARYTNGQTFYESDTGFTVPSAAFPRS